jgi:hypothetical protein
MRQVFPGMAPYVNHARVAAQRIVQNRVGRLPFASRAGY